MEGANMTIVPPASSEHTYPVVTWDKANLSAGVVDKLVAFARTHEIAEVFWIASEKRTDIGMNKIHSDMSPKVAALLDRPEEFSEFNDAVMFLNTFYYTLDYLYRNNTVPTPTEEGQEVFIPCKIPNATGEIKLYNIMSQVPGATGLPRHYPVDHPKFKYHCAWCYNRHADKNKHLLKCGQCRVKRYCNKTCQTADWKENHKATCMPARLGDLLSDDQADSQ